MIVNTSLTAIFFFAFLFFGYRAANDLGLKITPKFSLPFVEVSLDENKSETNAGGDGGAVKIGQQNHGTAIGGNAGAGGPGGPGGIGGSVEVVGDNTGFVMGGEGGEAGQIDRGGRGGRSPLQVMMEEYPEEWKRISNSFGLSVEDAMKYGKGGDGAGPTTTPQ